MILSEHIIGAASSIVTNKLRSTLSMLGIIIWVFSIIVMMALGEGTTKTIVDRFNSLGANLITISPGRWNQSRVGSINPTDTSKLIDDQFLEYVTNIIGVKSISPTVTARKQLIYGTYNTNGNIVWVTPVYQTLKNLTVANGNFITDEDVAGGTMVAVLWYQLAKDAFDAEDPIGKEIKLENTIFTVVGTLADNSQANSRIYLPLSTVMSKITGSHYYSSLDIEVEDPTNIEFMKTFIEQELIRYLDITDTTNLPFQVSTLSEVLSTVETVTGTLTMFLAGIAAISLIVWGIGVMNIMLVSVTERTREIGIRKALGAMKSDILTQFLIEALIISILAGLIGIWLSYIVVAILNNFLSAVISVNSIILAFWSVVVIGIVFGILPASKAANLKPIDALRFE